MIYIGQPKLLSCVCMCTIISCLYLNIIIMEMDSYMHVGPSISSSSNHTKTPLHLSAQFCNINT